MKARILTSIVTGVLGASAAQAGSAFSTGDLEVIYSGLSHRFTRNMDVSGYYTALTQLRAAADKPTCNWREAKNDPDSKVPPR